MEHVSNKENPGDAHVFPDAFEDWVPSDYVPSGQHTGTPCNRYVVRQPDGHRDVDDFESGDYSFEAFGLRKVVGGQFQSRVRSSDFHGFDVIAYCPDFLKPYATDLFGVAVPGVFNFELLDYYQQKLSLVGAAHLHMHAPDMKGAAVLAFNSDGSLRYLESRIGTTRHHDMAFVDGTRTIIKIGGQFASRRQVGGRELFGVPLWSFLERTCLWIETSSELDRPFELESAVGHGKSHVDVPELTRFNNRLIARRLRLNSDSEGHIRLDNDGSTVSASTGMSSLEVDWSGRHIRASLLGDEGQELVLDADGSAHQRYEAILPKASLAIDQSTAPHPSDVVQFAKSAYLVGHSLLAGRDVSGRILTI